MIKVSDQLKQLHTRLDPERPLDRPDLYVEGPDSPSARIAGEILYNTARRSKYLLVGARGVGKSTELRRLAQRLAPSFCVETVDLDAAGITASSVTAFDLLYLCGVALLRPLRQADAKRAAALFTRLRAAYAREAPASDLGTLSQALEGLGSFAGTVGEVAADSIAPGIGKVLGATVKGIRLLTRGDLVPESSPAGHRLLLTCAEIAQALRERRDAAPLCVLIDGLEKMNGEANDRFRQVFEYTRLLADAPFTLIIAAPPSTLTVVDSVLNLGYQLVTVWGFPHAPALLDRMACLRFEDVGLNPEVTLPPPLRQLAIEASGGLPRHLIQILERAVLSAGQAGRAALNATDVDGGILTLGRRLAQAVGERHVALLLKVDATGRLPTDELVPSLFASGRILALPPEAHTLATRYCAHPLIKRAFFPPTP